MLLQVTISIQILSVIYIKNCRKSDMSCSRQNYLKQSQHISGMINVRAYVHEVIADKPFTDE